MKESVVEVQNVSMTFESASGTVQALENVNGSIWEGHINVIVGPSGCGKSTLLNALAGLLPASAKITGRLEVKPGTRLGYVFQRDALMPWRTILGNTEFGLEVQGVPKPERHERLKKWFDLMGLKGFENHYPYQLSGGMRQRASLIRTLVCEPDLVLMDEPFGALDAHTRAIMQNEVLRIWRETRKTFLLVTHDLTEAIVLGHQIFVMSKRPGRIKESFEVTLPEPRDAHETRVSQDFETLFKRIWEVLRSEMTTPKE